MSKFKYQSNKNKVLGALNNAEKRALDGVGEFIKGRAKLLAAVDTGGMRASISHIVDEKNARVVVGSNAEHAIYQEFGTGKHAEKGNGRKGGWTYKDPKTGKTIFTYGNKPQPFLRPAAENNKSQITKLAEQLLKLK